MHEEALENEAKAREQAFAQMAQSLDARLSQLEQQSKDLREEDLAEGVKKLHILEEMLDRERCSHKEALKNEAKIREESLEQLASKLEVSWMQFRQQSQEDLQACIAQQYVGKQQFQEALDEKGQMHENMRTQLEQIRVVVWALRDKTSEKDEMLLHLMQRKEDQRLHDEAVESEAQAHTKTLAHLAEKLEEDCIQPTKRLQEELQASIAQRLAEDERQLELALERGALAHERARAQFIEILDENWSSNGEMLDKEVATRAGMGALEEVRADLMHRMQQERWFHKNDRTCTESMAQLAQPTQQLQEELQAVARASSDVLDEMRVELAQRLEEERRLVQVALENEAIARKEAISSLEQHPAHATEELRTLLAQGLDGERRALEETVAREVGALVDAQNWFARRLGEAEDELRRQWLTSPQDSPCGPPPRPIIRRKTIGTLPDRTPEPSYRREPSPVEVRACSQLRPPCGKAEVTPTSTKVKRPSLRAPKPRRLWQNGAGPPAPPMPAPPVPSLPTPRNLGDSPKA